MTPFPQSSSPSLPSVICSVLLACRQEGITAGVERIREGVKRALPCLEDQQLASVVHRTLRSLIKARRVYYTGRGYFLVTPEKGQEIGRDQKRILRRLVDSNTQTEDPTYESPAAEEGWRCQSPSAPLPLISTPTSVPFSSPSLVADSRLSHHCQLGRSQSLRGKRREARREGGERGGSLRLSDQQASKLLEKERHTYNEERGNSRAVRLRRDLLANNDGLENDGSKGGKREPEVDGIQGRKLERKNSLLSRLFGRKKSGDEETSAVVEEGKKEIRVFSAQFPPPDINIPKVHPKSQNSLPFEIILKS